MSVNHFTVTVILFYLQNAANNDRILNSIFGISGKKLNKVTHMISCHGFCMFTGQSTLIIITVHFFSIMMFFFAEKNQKETLSSNGNKNIGERFIGIFLYHYQNKKIEYY